LLVVVEPRQVSLPKIHTGDIAMRINRNTQIPNTIVYVVLYAIVFGISFWLLIAHSESPTNWQVYVLMIGAVLAGAIQFAVHSWKQHRTAQNN
jgi:uncharacterized membrane protein YdjX (TVP38/TMEM64 family)